VKVWASFWRVTAPYRNTAVGRTVGSLDSVFALRGHYITSSPISCVIRVIIDNQAFYVKTYTRGGKKLKRWFGRSRARAEWENLRYFDRLGIPTAPLVAYGQEMRGGSFRRGALVTREVAGTHDLAQLCADPHPCFKRRRWVRDVRRQIADYTRRLHRDGFGHRDLKLRNILVTLGGTPRVYFIDCPAGRHRRGPMAERWFIKDLAGLDRDARQCASRTERLRFFLEYRGRQTLQSADKQILAQVLRFDRNRAAPQHLKTAPAVSQPRIPYYDAKTLRRAGRNLHPPFLIHCEHDGMLAPLVCQDILRHLPGKRLVCRVLSEQGQIAIAKIYVDRRRARRHLKRELKGLRALQTARLAAPAVLYQGRIGEGGTLLLLAEIQNACGLDQYWSDTADDALRRQTIERVVDCIARLHAAGLSQRDLHLGNFLVGQGRIWTIDGSAIQTRPWRRPLSVGPSLSNLALFGAQFDRDDGYAVLQALPTYCRTRNWSPQPAWQPKLQSLMRQQRIRRLGKRSRKMTRSSTAAMARKRWRHYILCDRRWYRPACEILLKDPDRFIECGTLIKAGNTSTVARVRFEGEDLVIKRYNLKNGRHFLRRCLRPSRALQSWRNAHILDLLAINTPRPLAMVEERWGPLHLRAYYISAFQPGSTLASYWRRDWTAEDRRDAPLDALQRLLQKMADAQICHGDCKASNLMVDGHRIALLDLDSLRIFRSERAFLKRFRRDCQRFQHNWSHHPLIRQQIEAALARLDLPAGRRLDDLA
jgi:tRNA A-37 threonylcarbamoyl transferase component Bud32